MRKTTVFLLLMLAFLAATTTSCVTSKKVRYLRDMPPYGVPLNDRFEATIVPYDELRIYVLADGKNEELVKPFNVLGTAGTNVSNNQMGYLVDVNGNIQFPILGTLHVAGLTRLELQDTISKMLVSNALLTDAVVVVRFSNFKIFFLGAEGGKAITISNERCTFLEALALAGGLNAYTSRNKIAVMREVDGKMVMRYLDPRSSSVFQDPFFMLQQNDFIITQNYTKETPRREARNFASWLSVGLSTLTFFVTVIGYIKPKN